ncbi:cytidine deaminase [Pseudoalteromonas mariniglutinosa]|uniref:cytidine deaminase n=1 Tax=Pseudoalteromonas mariniglutinosa TaxID=206042 RepID=UPI00384ADD46
MTASNKSHQAAHFSFSEQQLSMLFKHVKDQQGMLSHNDIADLCQQHSLSEHQLLRACLPVAAKFAVAPVSQFQVGAIVLGIDVHHNKCFYFGANSEFSQQALSLVVHAEQSAINNAWLKGVTAITKIAISDAPCGYCRQFMNELADADKFDILLPNQQFKLAELLPHAFGPTDLNKSVSLFNDAVHHYQFAASLNCDAELQAQALQAYVPYTGNFSAVKISTFNDGDFYGRYAENAAYSPSLSPLQSAISQFYLAGLTFNRETVKSVELLQTNGKANQQAVTEAVLASFTGLPALNSHTGSVQQ